MEIFLIVGITVSTQITFTCNFCTKLYNPKTISVGQNSKLKKCGNLTLNAFIIKVTQSTFLSHQYATSYLGKTTLVAWRKTE